MIEGVVIKPLKIFPDIPDVQEQNVKPGFLAEVLRSDEGLLKKFGQTVFTVAYQGTIKAFHWHTKQDDLWFVATGMAQIVLYDRRPNSKSKGKTQVIMAGERDYKLILIPAGIAHGYQVLSKEPVLLFYHTTETYNKNSPDEERIPFDDPTINFDWSTNNKNYG
ncbi:MAG: dTDP-4-dehydrorhamnose 3,5-epimerase family protein [Patescibacteria group bacterium]